MSAAVSAKSVADAIQSVIANGRGADGSRLAWRENQLTPPAARPSGATTSGASDRASSPDRAALPAQQRPTFRPDAAATRWRRQLAERRLRFQIARTRFDRRGAEAERVRQAEQVDECVQVRDVSRRVRGHLDARRGEARPEEAREGRAAEHAHARAAARELRHEAREQDRVAEALFRHDEDRPAGRRAAVPPRQSPHAPREARLLQAPLVFRPARVELALAQQRVREPQVEANGVGVVAEEGALDLSGFANRRALKNARLRSSRAAVRPGASASARARTDEASSKSPVSMSAAPSACRSPGERSFRSSAAR